MVITMWALFALLALLIYIAGGRLTYYGDVLGEKWGVHRSFIGLVLLATITSLPELGTSLFSILLVDSPDLALGNVLGSNLFNLFIIPVLALLYHETFLYRARPQHASTGNLLLIVYAVIGVGLSLRQFGWELYSWFHISPFSVAILLLAVGGLYIIFSNRSVAPAEPGLEDADMYTDLAPGRSVIVFSISATLVILAGAGLAVVGKYLSVSTGLGDSFFGTLFFAFVTSLPEVVVSWMALKQLDAVNLAMGNIMGSCLFNLAIIFVFDLASVRGPIFNLAAASHLISVFVGIGMISLASYAILLRPERPAKRFFSIEMVLLSVFYFGGIYLLYVLR